MMLIILFFLLCISCVARSQFTFFNKLDLPSTSAGPEATAFDSLGRGTYTGISDGRILRYDGPIIGFTDFAYTSPNRSKAVCDGINNPGLGLGPVCGRPLGLGFHYLTKKLFVVDPFRGLVVVGPQGGLATQLATSAEGITFKSPNGLDVDQLTQDVYFTDGSTRFSLREITEAVTANDSTGRLIKYDSKTKQTQVLIKDLAGASGTSISADRSFVIVAEFIGFRIQKYWLRGAKAHTSEVLVNLPGMPYNIKRTIGGEFWVSLRMRNSFPAAVRINGLGNILHTVYLEKYYNNTGISEFQQRGLRYYVGSSVDDFIGVLS